MELLLKIPVVFEDLIVREIGDEIIILSQERDEIHQLESTSAFLWTLIDGKRNVEDILNCLCNEYEVAKNIAQNDLFEFLDDCIKKNLIYYTSYSAHKIP